MPVGFGQLEFLRDTWESWRRALEDSFSVGTGRPPRGKQWCSTGAREEDKITPWGTRPGCRQLTPQQSLPGASAPSPEALGDKKLMKATAASKTCVCHLHRSLWMSAAQWGQLSLQLSSIVAESKTDFHFLSRSRGRGE